MILFVVMGLISRFERWWLNALPHRMHIQHAVPRFLKSSPEPFRGEVLEVGAGSGWTSQQILETFPQVELTATDLDPRATTSFKHVKEKYGKRLKVQEADILHLPFDRAAFDIVIAVHALHHVSDLSKAVEEILRVLRPGGLVGVADEDQRYVVGPLRWFWRSENRAGVRDVAQIFEEQGAEIIATDGDVHFSLWARKPYPENHSDEGTV